jgi:hypothetical protein
MNRKDVIKKFLGEPVKNTCQSFYDDFIQANAEFRTKSGLKETITRTVIGKCCDWCEQLAGTYEYPDVPDDVYRRHNRCKCVVVHKSDKGIQNVYSKKFLTKAEQEALENRKTIGLENSKLINDVTEDITSKYLKNSKPGKGALVQDKGVDPVKSKDEIKDAEWLHRYLGGDIRIIKESTIKGEFSPDYEWNNRMWERKSFTTSSYGTIDKRLQHAIKQISKKPGGILIDVTNSPLSLESATHIVSKSLKTRAIKTIDVIVKKGDSFIVLKINKE